MPLLNIASPTTMMGLLNCSAQSIVEFAFSTYKFRLISSLEHPVEMLSQKYGSTPRMSNVCGGEKCVPRNESTDRLFSAKVIADFLSGKTSLNVSSMPFRNAWLGM